MREILFRGKAMNRDKGAHRTSYKNGDKVHNHVAIEIGAEHAVVEVVKPQIIREFAKFLIDKSENGVISASDIPGFVKEMTEEKL